MSGNDFYYGQIIYDLDTIRRLVNVAELGPVFYTSDGVTRSLLRIEGYLKEAEGECSKLHRVAFMDR
jgi:hypothetical protein